jgi:hypothetical protein
MVVEKEYYKEEEEFHGFVYYRGVMQLEELSLHLFVNKLLNIKNKN